MYEQNTVCILYKKLLTFYPDNFRERLGESMEQTFHDLWNEKKQTKKELLSFVFLTFLETAVGIFREHLLLISSGGIMQNILKTIGSPALISLLLILPLMIMEVVNRRNFNEDFPTFLFFILWLNLFSISLILLPIVQAWRTGNRDTASPILTQGNTLLTNPKWAMIISVILFFSPGILPLLESVGLLSLDRLFNGPNPEVEYIPGLIITVGVTFFPIAAGIIAGRPIVRTLQVGGNLVLYPINLIIVFVISFLFASGVISLIVDQWPCFIGVPVCD